MKYRSPAFLLFLLALGPASVAHAQEARTSRPTPIRWAHDGVHLVIGERGTATWIEPESGDVVTASPAPAPDDPRAAPLAAFAAAMGRELTAEEARGDRTRSTLPRAPSTATGVLVDEDGDVAAAVLDGCLWVWRADEDARAVGEDGLDGVRHFRLAPDGSAASYLDGHDLWLVRTSDGKRTRVTEDGGEELFNGELDWVYQEELYGRFDFQGAWWSPASEHLAFLRIDESGVDTYVVTDYRPQQLALESIKYPKAGTTNPRATLHVARASDGRVTAADLSGYAPEEGILLVRVGWTPDGDACVAMVQDREQTWLDLVLVDPETGAARRLLRETAEDGWVDRANEPHWLADGTFLWESARTGFEHIYRYDRTGELVATVTAGEWRVRRIAQVDEREDGAGSVTVTGSAPGYAIGDTHWRARLDGSGIVRLTEGRGHWRLDWNEAGDLAVARVEHLENPGETWLLDAGGRRVRLLARTPAPEAAVFPEWHQISARDGEWLDVVVTWPDDVDPAGSYPVWLDTYAGPDSASVSDRWRGPANGRWYIDLDVNVRSASGRGMRYTKTCYRDFGAQELADLEDAVDWLCRTYPFADRARVGISGWSYGGFMAAYAMTKSDAFACGIAGGGVFDWALYDTIYTERYMGTPQSNPEGYARSSVVAAAKDLKGPLLIVHGGMDDNVHVQNALQLAHALQEAEHQHFELMIYPSARHGVRSPHWPELRRRFMERHLGSPGEPATAPTAAAADAATVGAQ